MRAPIHCAIVGATGTVGEILLELLQESQLPLGRVVLLASQRSAGRAIRFRQKTLSVQALEDFDFAGIDCAFFTAGHKISSQFVPRAQQAGAYIIDNTSAFRLDPKVALVVPEVNGHLLGESRSGDIIANPNCVVAQMVLALNPLHQRYGLKRIEVATYQSVSGTGRQAIRELAHQTGELLNGRPVSPHIYQKQIAFNVLGQIDDLGEDGFSFEERKIRQETAKIWADATIAVNPTAVRVPVFYGHALALHVLCEKPVALAEVITQLKAAPGLKFHPKNVPSPLDVIGQDAVHVGRVRLDPRDPTRLNMWVVADNTRKGAALNALQIFEGLFR